MAVEIIRYQTVPAEAAAEYEHIALDESSAIGIVVGVMSIRPDAEHVELTLAGEPLQIQAAHKLVEMKVPDISSLLGAGYEV